MTTIDVELSSLDINQCSGGEDSNDVFDPFVDTHLCKNTTQVRHIVIFTVLLSYTDEEHQKRIKRLSKQ